MKEILKKFAEGYAEIAKFLKEGKTDEAISLIEKSSEEVEAQIDAVEETDPVTPAAVDPVPTDSEAIEKAVNEQLKKWAWLETGAETLQELFAQVKAAGDQMTAIQKTQEDLITKNADLEAKNAELEKQLSTVESKQIEKSTSGKFQIPFVGP